MYLFTDIYNNNIHIGYCKINILFFKYHHLNNNLDYNEKSSPNI